VFIWHREQYIYKKPLLYEFIKVTGGYKYKE
jgi:hypothetical protein